MREQYPHRLTADLARELGRTERSVYRHADAMGLHKSAEYLASPAASRWRKGTNRGGEHRFQPGHATWNAGRQGWDAGGRSHDTRFQAGQRTGQAARHWAPIGTETTDTDGYRWRKVADTGRKSTDWKCVHVLTWEQQNGPVPAGHAVVFRDRDKTNAAIENLEMVTRAELMRRNTIHRFPPELKSTIRLAARLRKAIAEAEESRQ